MGLVRLELTTSRLKARYSTIELQTQKKGLNFQGSVEDGGVGAERPCFPTHKSNISWLAWLVNGAVAGWWSGYKQKRGRSFCLPLLRYLQSQFNLSLSTNKRSKHRIPGI